MTIKDRMQLINLATKGLDGAVKTHLTEKIKGYSWIPKQCTRTAIKRRIMQLRIDLHELEREIDQ